MDLKPARRASMSRLAARSAFTLSWHACPPEIGQFDIRGGTCSHVVAWYGYAVETRILAVAKTCRICNTHTEPADPARGIRTINSRRISFEWYRLVVLSTPCLAAKFKMPWWYYEIWFIVIDTALHRGDILELRPYSGRCHTRPRQHHRSLMRIIRTTAPLAMPCHRRPCPAADFGRRRCFHWQLKIRRIGGWSKAYLYIDATDPEGAVLRQDLVALHDTPQLMLPEKRKDEDPGLGVLHKFFLFFANVYLFMTNTKTRWRHLCFCVKMGWIY